RDGTFRVIPGYGLRAGEGLRWETVSGASTAGKRLDATRQVFAGTAVDRFLEHSSTSRRNMMPQP
ncbi:MAG: hypothetical protein JRN54_03935, partial [Nitrososphaerota archaeon]|nr:hypothetical protein [Nitrososphaerota archaeon]